MIFLGGNCVHAVAEGGDYREELGNIVEEQLEQLDLRALEEYVESLQGAGTEDLKDRLLSYITGGGFGLDTFFQDVLQLLFDSVKKLIPSFACIAAVGLL